MKLPKEVIPILEATVHNPAFPRGLPLEIWREELHIRVDAFADFGERLFASGLDFSRLPRGYGLAGYLFDWEAQCHYDGWSAIGNRADTMHQVIASLGAVGLAAEADAVSRALAAWQQSDGDYDSASEAYHSVPHAYLSDVDRMEYLVCYFCDHADELFYCD